MKRTLFLLSLAVLVLSLTVPMVFGAQEESLSLQYDDRKELSELLGTDATSVEISNQTVTSTVTGTEEQDANVLVYQDGILYAVGCGTATLTVDGAVYTVNVSPAPLSIFMITGHSIGAGEAGTASQSVVSEAGQTYSTTKGQLTSATGGLGYGAPTRATEYLDAFAPGGGGTKGIDSGLAWQWNQLTGEKVWVLNMAVSGSCLNEWQPGAEGHNSTWSYPYDSAAAAFSYAQQILKNEIAAGHYTLGNMMILYHNGANFVNYPGWTMESVEKDYENMWESYKADLSVDMDGDEISETVEALGMIPSWKPTLNSYAYDKPAGYYMSASADYPEFFIASNATRDWLTEEGLTLFPAINYTTQSKAVYIPESILHTNQGGTSSNSLFCSADKAHLSQVTYNAVGIDAASNMLTFLRGTDIDAQTVEFKNIGLDTVTTLDLTVNEPYQIIPVTSPAYGQGVTFEVSGSISMSYPLVITAESTGSGTLTAKRNGQTVATLNVTVTGEAHSHCECGEQAVGIGDHSCQTVGNWIPWGNSDTASLPVTSGYYYLVADMVLTESSTIAVGEDVHLCLNGHTITSSARTFNIKGNLALTDCSDAQSGLITSSSTTNYGAVFYCYVDSVLNLYGGTLTTTGTNLSGAIGTVGNAADEPATMNMYGGKLTGGTVTHRGGNLFIISGSTLNIYGGTIENGTTESTYSTTSSHGGNIYISSSTVNIMGGTVTGGTTGHLGGNIYLASGNLNISGGTVTAGTAPNGGNIAIASGKTVTISGGTVSDGVAETYGANIYTDGGTVKVTGGTVSGGTAGARAGGIYIIGGTLAMSGGTVTGGYAGTSGGNIAGASGATLNISGGTVQNGNAATYGGNISLIGKTTLNISGSAMIKDGYTGTSGTTGSGGNIYGGYSSATAFSTINISGGTVSGGRAKEGGNIKFDGNGYITGGTISGGTATSGGSIYRTGRTACELVISNGTVTGGSATNGGNIYVSYSGRLTVTGGLITKGTANSTSGGGGNIYGYFATANGTSTQSVITIAGGSISDGSANTGGNIEFEGTGIITGGNISGGSAVTGGNIYLDVKYESQVVYSSLTMTGGVIENGSATYGGNLQVMANFTMRGGTIRNGTATSTGGNIRIYRPAVFTLIDGTISGGSAASGGNLCISGYQKTSLYAANATFNMQGGTVADGRANNHGGNIYIFHFADMVMTGGIIRDGQSTTTGGNIAMYPTTYTSSGSTIQRPATLTMTGGTISGGTASRGGNIGIRYDSTSTATLLLSGTIRDGSGNKGGNIYVTSYSSVTLDGATVTGGTATETGGNIYITRYVTADGTTDLIIKGDTVLNSSQSDLYIGNSSATETCYVNVVFEALSGKDKIIRVNASAKPAAFASSEEDISKWLVCSASGYSVQWSEGTLSITEDSSPKTAAIYNGTVLQGEYSTFGQAADVVGTDEYIKLLCDSDAAGYELTGTAWVDLNGYNLTGLTVSGTLYGMDRNTDSYSDENTGSLTATVIGNGSIPVACKTDTAMYGSVKRYLAVCDDNGTYTFHRFYLGIVKTSIKPSSLSIGYKALFAGSDTVKDQLYRYGYSMWVDEAHKIVRYHNGSEFTSMEEISLRVDHFLDEALSDEENAIRANTQVNAQVYLQLKSGEVIESVSVAYSFMDMTETVSALFDTYTETQQNALRSLGQRFNSLMFGWSVPNIHHEDDSWTAWTGTSSLPTSGKIYLDTDVSLSKTCTISANTTLTICLNGHTLQSSSRIWAVYGTLNICDCCHKLDENSQGTVIGNSSSLVPVMYTYYGSQVNLYGGNLTASKSVAQGGVIALGNDQNTAATGTGDTVFNMYGGSISGGNVTKSGGNISAWHGGTFNMYGGTVSGGTATGNGGNFYISSAASDTSPFILNLYGGTVSGGTATGNGGNFYITSAASDTVPFILNLYGGTVSGGYALGNGGNIYAAEKTEIHIYDAAVIEGGTGTMGGNIYVLSQSFTMDGGLIQGGSAENGGGLAFSSNTSASLSGGTISGGYASVSGGNVYIHNKGSYTFTDMCLRDGSALNDGGNLYIYRDMYGDTYLKDTTPYITLSDVTVTGGTAGHLGGGIYNMEGELTLSGNCQITGNNGSNLYLDAGQTVTVQDLAHNAAVGVTMGVAGKIAAGTEFAGCILSDSADHTVTTTDTHIILQSSTSVKVPELNAYSVGWYRGIVTSPFPVPLDGMGKNVERMNTYNVLTELEASMVVFADEDGLDNAILMCTMDTIVIPEEFSDAIAAVISDATGIPADRIFIAGTHTHAAVSIDENHESTKEYLQWVYPLLAEYAVLAVEDLAPVSSTQMIRVNADGMTQVRRYVDADGNAYSTVDGNVPDGAVAETDPDTELQAIRFSRYDTTGKDDVILANFQSHPGHDATSANGNVSSEMWGAFRQSVESQMEHTVCGFFLGAAGNQQRGKSTAYESADGETYNLTKKEEYGAALAAHLIKGFETPTEINTGDFDLEVAHYAFQAEDWYKSSFSGDVDRPLTLNAVSIGDFAFITAPYEMFHENGEQLKDFVYENDLFDLLFVISNSNGANKYIASYLAFENDETDGTLTSFEVRSTRFVKGMAEALITCHAEMLAELSGETVEVPDFLEEAKEATA